MAIDTMLNVPVNQNDIEVLSLMKSGGGAATSGGIDYQNRVAAWVAVNILASSNTPWRLPVGTTLNWLWCETEQPVDDLMIGTSSGGVVYMQIKRHLHLSKSRNSDLASAIDQFVRQYTACQGRDSGTSPWDRPLDHERDRLVLVTSSRSSSPIREDLPQVLNRLRHLVTGQTIDGVATNEGQYRCLSIIRQHIAQTWQKLLGVAPCEDEIVQLLRLIYVQVLDVEQDTVGEREAVHLLRTVLQNPNEVAPAWATLISCCASLAANQSGAKLPDLQKMLLSFGFTLKIPSSFSRDVDRLRNYSRTVLDALKSLAVIRTRHSTVKIKRPVSEALRQVVEQGSILVIGDPGSGKSAVISDLVEFFAEQKRDFVFLAVDRIEAGSLSSLRREIGIDHELVDILDNWPGTQPAFVVIDALDAARGDVAQQMILDLIRVITSRKSRWRVVASIRRYDLRNSHDLPYLFKGEPPIEEFCDPGFRLVRHLNIPPKLSEDELNQLEAQDLELWSLYTGVDQQYRDLLKVPFNLRLLAEIAHTGEAVDEIKSIRTRLELIDRYWMSRVIRRDGRGDAREVILKAACEKMLEAKTLRIDRFKVVTPGNSQDLDDLLKNQVLVEWQPNMASAADRYTLAFSHNALFDYAVARLLLRGDRKHLVSLFHDHSELVLIARPSLDLHFRHVWESDSTRTEFWKLVLEVFQKDDVPEIVKIIGPSVAAEVAKELTDLQVLCSALFDADHSVRKYAAQALKHLCGAALTAGQSEVKKQAKLVGEGAGPWCDLLEHVSADLTVDIAHLILPLLVIVCERPEELTLHQKRSVGIAARRMLALAWSTDPRNKWLAVRALEGVCRTYESDPHASREIISRCIESDHLSLYGYEEMPWLAREVPRLIDHDPDLVEAIYRAAFRYEERSTESTTIGGNLVIPLLSNRRQDYESALYLLAESFQAFLSKAPLHATEALIAAVEPYAKKRGYITKEREYAIELEDGRQMSLINDYSSLWDGAEPYEHDEPIKMLAAFEHYLLESSKTSNRVDEIYEVINLLIKRNRYAIVWRHVISAAVRVPDILGRAILPLISTVEFMICHDTSILVGNLLSVLFPLLTQQERQRVEQTILSIPERATNLSLIDAERIRNRLLGCLTNVHIISQEVRNLLDLLKDRNEIPPNKPVTQISTVWAKYNEDEYLKDLGVPIDDPSNRSIRDLAEPVRKFVERYRNSRPPADEVSQIMGLLRTIYSAIIETQGAHRQQRMYAWSYLTEACALIAATGLEDCDPSNTALLQRILFKASNCDVPAPDPQMDAQFDERPLWGNPAPRVYAAEGLVNLVANSSHVSTEVIDLIRELADDPVPAVRFQIARGLYALARHNDDQMWRLIEWRIADEQSGGVLQGLLAGTLQQLMARDPDRVAALVKCIYKRQHDVPGAKNVRMLCISLVSELYIKRNHQACDDIIVRIVKNPADRKDEAIHLLSQIQDYLTFGPIDRLDPTADAIRNRAFSILSSVVQSVQRGLQNIEHRMERVSFEDLPTVEQNKFKSLAELEVSIARLVFFASGAYVAQKGNNRDLDKNEITKIGKRFYQEAKQIIEELADIRFPAAAHYLLETLEFCIPFDPAQVFVTVGHTVRTASRTGYQYDSLAVDLLVRIVERYLAEYRTLLKEQSDCVQTLIEILDVFVKAGWPSATRLTYQLERIYR